MNEKKTKLRQKGKEQTYEVFLRKYNIEHRTMQC